MKKLTTFVFVMSLLVSSSAYATGGKKFPPVEQQSNQSFMVVLLNWLNISSL